MKCPHCGTQPRKIKQQAAQRVYNCTRCKRQFTTREVHTNEYMRHEMRVMRAVFANVRQQMLDLAREVLREKGYLR